MRQSRSRVVRNLLLAFGSESPAIAECRLVSHQRLGVTHRGVLALHLGKPFTRQAIRVGRNLLRGDGSQEDGLLVGSIRAPGRTQVVRARGTLAEVQSLQRTLSRNRFGSEIGRCYYRDQPGQGEVYRSALTWFGRTGDRKTTVTLGDPFAVLCGDRLIGSIEAIMQFYFDAIGRPDAQFEDLPQDIFGFGSPEAQILR